MSGLSNSSGHLKYSYSQIKFQMFPVPSISDILEQKDQWENKE